MAQTCTQSVCLVLLDFEVYYDATPALITLWYAHISSRSEGESVKSAGLFFVQV